MSKYNAADIVRTSWAWDEGRHNQTDVIALSAQLHTARQLERIANTLDRLLVELSATRRGVIKADVKRSIAAHLRAAKRATRAAP